VVRRPVDGSHKDGLQRSLPPATLALLSASSLHYKMDLLTHFSERECGKTDGMVLGVAQVVEHSPRKLKALSSP
jgi:hypothetical protein